jgi:hypothetical protein
MPGVPLRLMLFLAALSCAGCALTRSTGGRGGMRDIQPDEIQGSSEHNVLDLIEQIRPSWLYSHDLRDPADPGETAGPLVMINGLPPHPLFTLEYFPLENVREIQYLTATYALQRYRVNSPAGVILVITEPPVGPDPTVKPDTGRILPEDAPDLFSGPMVRIAPSSIRRTFSCNSPSRSWS